MESLEVPTIESSSSEIFTHEYLEMDVNEASHYDAMISKHQISDSEVERINHSIAASQALDSDNTKIREYSFA